MKTIQKIIELHGGLEALKANYISIENEPYMRLVIEYIGEGPRGLPHISVAHYGEQNGDAMRDPEMCFEVSDDIWGPTYFRNDYMGIEQEAVFTGEDGQTYLRPRLISDLKSFYRTWSKNLKEQGFIEAYQAQKVTA